MVQVTEGIEEKRRTGAAQRRKAVRIAATVLGVGWCVGTVFACVYATMAMAVVGGITLVAIGLTACSRVDVCQDCRYEITVGRVICEKCERASRRARAANGACAAICESRPTANSSSQAVQFQT